MSLGSQREAFVCDAECRQIVLNDVCVNATAKKVFVTWRECTHYIGAAGVENFRGTVAMHWLANIPHFTSVVEGSCGEDVWRVVRETADIDRMVMHPESSLHDFSTLDVVDRDVMSRTTCEKKVVSAIDTQRRKPWEALNLQNLLQSNLLRISLRVVPEEVDVAGIGSTTNSCMGIVMHPRQCDNWSVVNHDTRSHIFIVCLDNIHASSGITYEDDVWQAWMELKLASLLRVGDHLRGIVRHQTCQCTFDARFQDCSIVGMPALSGPFRC